MHSSNLPRVRDSVLHYTTSAADEQTPIFVGSAEWYQALEQIDSFGFEDQRGRSFTARREPRDQQWYWYAYRKQGKQLRKRYLGKTEQLAPARLQAAARDLAVLPCNAHPNASTTSLAPASVGPLSDGFFRPNRLQAPTPPANLLPRPRLTRQLRRPPQRVPAARQPGPPRTQTLLTVITAPTGYGKSTLLSEWLHHEDDLNVGWLSLAREHNDIRHFWRDVIAALQASLADVGHQALLILQGPETFSIDAALTALLADLQCAPCPLVLVLDDFHHVDTPAIHTTLAAVLAHCPPHVHVVIASQTRPPLPYGRLRLRHDLTELQATDLRLTDEEGSALLRRDPRLGDHPQAIATVLRITEGWLTGVQLFLLALQRHGDLEAVLDTFDGTHPYLTEYVLESVWRQQPPEIQSFLLHTAILDQLSGPLCAAVTGRPDGSQLLAQLAQANLFVTIVEGRPGWYRYHRLFGHVLRWMLEQLHPADLPTLHRRAAAWYLAQRASGDALRHLLAGQCWSEAAEVLDQDALPMLQDGDVARVLVWLGQLPQEVIRQRPALLLLKARALLLVGELNALDAWLEHLEASSASTPMLEEVARIRRLVGISAGRCGSATSGEGTDWENLDAFTRSMHRWAQDDIQASFAAAAQAAQLGHASGFRSIRLLAAGTMALLHLVGGELRAAQQVAYEALALAHTTEAAVLTGAQPPNPATAAIMLALGVTAYERNQLAVAQQRLGRALELGVQLGREDLLFATHLWLARTLAARGQRQEAGVLLQTGVRRARNGRLACWPEADVLAYQAWIRLQCGELALAAQWAETAGVQLHDQRPASQRIVVWVYGEVLLAQAQYEDAATILGQLIQRTPQRGARTEPLLKLLVAHAIALFAQGQRGAALAVLERALDLGQREGYIRPFLDVAPQHTRALLELYCQKTRGEAARDRYVRQLLAEGEAVLLSTAAPAGGILPALALSRREREVLRLVEAGLSNQEIAQKLVIEMNTVKSHLHRIYQRLRVRTRHQAVKHARTLQML